MEFMFFKVFKLAKNENHVFRVFLSFQKMNFMFLRFLSLHSICFGGSIMKSDYNHCMSDQMSGHKIIITGTQPGLEL